MKVLPAVRQAVIRVVVALVLVITGMPWAAEAFTVSGTTAYSGSRSGRIYISLIKSSGGSFGVSIPQSGNFQINGVPDGEYRLRAFMDSTGTGINHASDPFFMASSLVKVTADMNLGTLTLTDREAGTLIPPSNIRTPTGFSSPVVQWDVPRNSLQQIIPQKVTVYWSTDPNNVLSGKKVEVPADKNFLIIPDVIDYYYFALTSSSDGVEGSPSPAVFIWDFTGDAGNAISGTITFGNMEAGHPFYLMAEGENGRSFLTPISNPVSVQSYSINCGDGAFSLRGFQDMNGNGIIDAGDVIYDDQAALPVTLLSGESQAGINRIFLPANSFHRVRTDHRQGLEGDRYFVDFKVERATKLPVNVTLQSAPGSPGSSIVPVPASIGKDENGSFTGRFAVPRPVPGDLYVLDIEYFDGTVETVPLQVTGVVDRFALPVYPAGVVPYANPILQWAGPSGPSSPEPAVLDIAVNASQGNDQWVTWSINGWNGGWWTWLVYNYDGSAFGLGSNGLLPEAGQYEWSVAVRDQYGNHATAPASFSFASGLGSITGQILDTTGSPVVGATATVYNLDDTPVANVGQGVMGYEGMKYSVSVPAGQYKVYFQRPGFISQWYNQMPDKSGAAIVTVSADSVTPTIDGLLRASEQVNSVSGVVSDVSSGAALAGVLVQLSDQQGNPTTFEAATDTNVSTVSAVFRMAPTMFGSRRWIRGVRHSGLMVSAQGKLQPQSALSTGQTRPR